MKRIIINQCNGKLWTYVIRFWLGLISVTYYVHFFFLVESCCVEHRIQFRNYKLQSFEIGGWIQSHYIYKMIDFQYLAFSKKKESKRNFIKEILCIFLVLTLQYFSKN